MCTAHGQVILASNPLTGLTFVLSHDNCNENYTSKKTLKAPQKSLKRLTSLFEYVM